MSTNNTKTTSNKQEPVVIPGSGEKLQVPNKIYAAMDNNNKKAADIMASQGIDAAVKHMLKHPKTGETMDYATMRYFYG